MTDADRLDQLETELAMIKAHWFALGTAIHQRDWSEVQDVFRRMGSRLGESAERIDWSFEVGSEG
jgi:hypothetical protein